MAESIKKVCEDSEYQRILAQRGTKHAKNFSWESSTKKHMDLFDINIKLNAIDQIP